MPLKQKRAGPPAPPGWNMLGSLACPRGIVGQIAWSPDGRWLAASADDGCVYLWKFNPRRARRFDPQPAHALDFHHLGVVCSLAWSRDSRYLATGFTVGRVVIWDLEAEGPEPEWADFRQVGSLPVWVCWSPLTCILLCQTSDGRHGYVHLSWSPRSGFSEEPAVTRSRLRLPLRDDLTLSLPCPEEIASGSFRLAWSPDVRSLAWLSGDRAAEMDALTAPQLGGPRSRRGEWRRHALFRVQAPDPISALSISADRLLLVTSTGGGDHLLWSGQDGRSMGRLRWNPGRAYAGCADFHPTHNILAASGRIAQRVDLWEFDPELLESPLGLGGLAEGLALIRQAAGERPAPRVRISRAPAQEAEAAELSRLLAAAGVTILTQPGALAAADWLVVLGAPGYYEQAPAGDLEALQNRARVAMPPPRCIPVLAHPEGAEHLPGAFALLDPAPYAIHAGKNYAQALLHLLMALHEIELEDARFAAVREEVRRKGAT